MDRHSTPQSKQYLWVSACEIGRKCVWDARKIIHIHYLESRRTTNRCCVLLFDRLISLLILRLQFSKLNINVLIRPAWLPTFYDFISGNTNMNSTICGSLANYFANITVIFGLLQVKNFLKDIFIKELFEKNHNFYPFF